MTSSLLSAFHATFGRAATVLARAPGRVNIIGEHTDYNDGFVLPAAIERETRIAAAPRYDGMVRLVAPDLGRETTFALTDADGQVGVAPAPSPEERWSNYVRGVAAGLLAAGYPVRGMDAVVRRCAHRVGLVLVGRGGDGCGTGVCRDRRF